MATRKQVSPVRTARERLLPAYPPLPASLGGGLPEEHPAPAQPGLADTAYDRILAAIRGGTLAPSTRMRESRIADWLLISRTPVREAMQRLRAEGLLSVTPKEGLVVTRVDAALVAELYATREVLEGTAARFAADYALPADLQLLQELVETEAGPGKTPDANRRFHSALHRASRNRFLVKSLTVLQDSLSLLGRGALGSRPRARQAAKEHAGIAAAVISRDAGEAERLMREHIRAAYRERLYKLGEASKR